MRGTCHASFAYDVGMGIDLDAVERDVRLPAEREPMHLAHRSPPYFSYRPPPLRLTEHGPGIALAGFTTDTRARCVLFDFGAVSVSYSIPFDCELTELVRLADALHENAALLDDSRRRVVELVARLGAAIREPAVVPLVEDHVGYHFPEPVGPSGATPWLATNADVLARILRSEIGTISDEEVRDALEHATSYSKDDVVVVDWGASLLRIDDAEDVLAVLEFANVELLEMRHLDDRLDAALDQAYEALTRGSRWTRRPGPGSRAALSRLGRLQADAAVLFENVNSALKLVGDQYLARVYRLVAARFHLPTWDATILRKLAALDSIYQKVSDRQAARRMEVLEWIIIVLIAVSGILPLVARP